MSDANESDSEPAIDPLDPCCVKDAKTSISKHRDVAICGGCGRLILAWDNPDEQRKTRDELRGHGVSFSEGRQGALFLTAKVRAS
jgi:hypothetical protein